LEPIKPEVATRDESELKLKEVCPACHKQLAKGSSSTISSFLFQDSHCTCNGEQSSGPFIVAPPLPVFQPPPDANAPPCFPSIAQEDRQSDFAPTTDSITREILPAAKIAQENPKKLIGKIIGDGYQIVEFIGQGLSGHVYKVTRHGLTGAFALKIITPSMGFSKRSNNKFLQDAKRSRELDHHNIIALYDAGITDDLVPFLVTDFFEGDRLSDIIENDGALPEQDAVELFLQICEGLLHAHGMGVIHRDVKPSNVRVHQKDDGEQLVKLVDCGISKVLPDPTRETRYFTETGFEYGDARYMSPEQCRGAKTDHRSDIYSLGCLMYQCISGKTPFSSDRTSMLIYKHVRKRPKSLTLRFPDLEVSKDLENLIMRCLQKEPDDRYQTISDLKEDLESIKEKRPVKRAFKKKLIYKDRKDDSKGIFPESLDATISATWFSLSSTGRLVSIALTIMVLIGTLLIVLIKLNETHGPFIPSLPILASETREQRAVFESRMQKLETDAISLFDTTSYQDPAFGEKVQSLIGDIQIAREGHKSAFPPWTQEKETETAEGFQSRLTTLKASHSPTVSPVSNRHQIRDLDGKLLFETTPGTSRANTLLQAAKLGTDLTRANLSYSSLPYITISGANLEGADFTSSDLRGATFKDTNLTGVTLNYTNLEHSRFEKVNAENACMIGTVLQGSTIANTSFKGAGMRNVMMNDVDFFGGNMMNADLDSCNMENSLTLDSGQTFNMNATPAIVDLTKQLSDLEENYQRLGDLRLAIETMYTPGCGLSNDAMKVEMPVTRNDIILRRPIDAKDAEPLMKQIDHASATCMAVIADVREVRRAQIASFRAKEKSSMTNSSKRLKSETKALDAETLDINKAVAKLVEEQRTKRIQAAMEAQKAIPATGEAEESLTQQGPEVRAEYTPGSAVSTRQRSK